MGNSKKIETRLRVMEMVTEIASEATQNTNIVWMIEFQELLVERLYRKMLALLEESASKGQDQDNPGEDENGEHEEDEEVNPTLVARSA